MGASEFQCKSNIVGLWGTQGILISIPCFPALPSFLNQTDLYLHRGTPKAQNSISYLTLTRICSTWFNESGTGAKQTQGLLPGGCEYHFGSLTLGNSSGLSVIQGLNLQTGERVCGHDCRLCR